MVKAKKGKKEIATSASGGVSSGDEMDQTDLHETNIDSDAEEDNVSLKNKKNQQKTSKKNKKNRKDSEETEDDVGNITSGVKKLDLKTKPKSKGKSKQIDSDDEVEENDVDEIPPKSKKGNKKKSAFELLAADDDGEDYEPPAEEDEVVEEEKPNKPTKKEIKNTGKKGKKAKRGKDEDEDLDKILAELQAEYAGEATAPATNVVSPEDLEDEEFTKKKKNRGKKQKADMEAPADDADEVMVGDDDEGGDDEEGGTVKTAAQKKKEKKERQKREAALAKQRGAQQPKLQPTGKTDELPEPAVTEEKTEELKVGADVGYNEEVGVAEEDAAKDKKNKKKGKKDKKAEEEETKKDSKKKGMSAAMVAAMQERLKQIKEEEERQQRLEEERMRQEEERERQRLEAIRLEAERKEKKKQKEAERKARLKAEGKLLTKKQKEERARAQAMLEALKAQGLEIPDPTEKRPTRLGTRIRPKKKGPASKEEQAEADAKAAEEAAAAAKAQQEAAEKQEIVKDSWDASDSEEEANGDDDTSQATTTTTNNDEKSNSGGEVATIGSAANAEESSDEESEDDDDSEDESEGSDSESEKEEAINANDAEARRLRAEARILKRQDDAEKKRTVEDLRAAVVCVLGHVDTGKTKILDKLRRTHVQDSEAGGITQQIGATNVPIDAIKEQTKPVHNSSSFEFKLPGLLIIDTPGHESFSNLRNRGSSLCDIAILVVDIMHGLEPQTIESINLLKKKKCPFIVALNKIDRLYDWKVMARRDVRDVLKEQEANTQLEFKQRSKDVILQFAEQGLNAALFYENPDPKTYVSLVPTSAITGEGMGNLLFLIVEFCQKMLPKRLMYSEELQATVLEVKAIPGLGTTIDAILINGKLREGQTMIAAGTDGPIVTQIRSLLMPQPMKELRVKNAYIEYKEVKAAQGVKIAAKDLEKAIAGINLLIAHKPDEVEICKEEVARELKSALSHIKLAQTGVYVQASTLGSLEALLEFLRSSKIPVSEIF
ncbi:unnamed protein product [Ceratitis capitata]|uniref:(Mediterranean fruit fly) hypothetical protein n=1 Tax=Ceratitis capitata TaxID=7213 RepID=A0A811UYA7_CERCA|nr:unnamed protein product [Ceratitis capitata]